jgi:methionine sulfoxide reductase heme-binding subunit
LLRITSGYNGGKIPEILMTGLTASLGARLQVRGRRIPWWLFGAVAGVVVGIVGVCAAVWGLGEEGLLHVTRYTARWAFLIFAAVFASGALATLIPNSGTLWMKRNRRYLGLSFALAHYLHLLALSVLFVVIGESPDLVTILLGGLAFVFIGLMALTSNDWSVRTLGRNRWRLLHLVGAYYVWLIFMNSYVGRVVSDTPPEPRGIFVVLAATGVLALGLRIGAWLWRRRAVRTGAPA